jgi:hypothetical protein
LFGLPKSNLPEACLANEREGLEPWTRAKHESSASPSSFPTARYRPAADGGAIRSGRRRLGRWRRSPSGITTSRVLRCYPLTLILLGRPHRPADRSRRPEPPPEACEPEVPPAAARRCLQHLNGLVGLDWTLTRRWPTKASFGRTVPQSI